MNATEYAMKLRAEMHEIKEAMVEPGFSDYVAYREALGRFHGLKSALAKLKVSINEEDIKA